MHLRKRNETLEASLAPTHTRRILGEWSAGAPRRTLKSQLRLKI